MVNLAKLNSFRALHPNGLYQRSLGLSLELTGLKLEMTQPSDIEKGTNRNAGRSYSVSLQGILRQSVLLTSKRTAISLLIIAGSPATVEGELRYENNKITCHAIISTSRRADALVSDNRLCGYGIAVRIDELYATVGNTAYTVRATG